MSFLREDLRKCNACGSMNSSKLSKCHDCGNSLKAFKTDFVASIVKKQIVTDESKGSEGFWACKVCGEVNRNGNYYCHSCGEHWHSDNKKGLFSSITDKVLDKTKEQGIKGIDTDELKGVIAEKTADFIIKGLSKLFKK
jgi:uncharacterized membrane protein YvbJ